MTRIISRIIFLAFTALVFCGSAGAVSNPPSNYGPATQPYGGSEAWYCTQAGQDKECTPDGLATAPIFAAPATPPLTPSIFFTQTPGPFAGAFSALGVDTDPLRAWCYKGDGTSHILSTVTDCNGTNTSGFTLGQWQAVLPAALALSDEVDVTAINSLIAAQGSNPTALNLYGRAMINRSIASCAGNLYLQGNGLGTSINVNSGSITAFKHCQSLGAPPGAQWSLQNITVNCTGTLTCGDFADVTLANSGEPGLYMRNVHVDVASAAHWANGLMTTGAGGTRIENSVITLSIAAISGTCWSVTDASPFTVLLQVLNVHFFGCATAEQVTSSTTTPGVQGIWNVGVNANQILDFFKYTGTSATSSPPEFVFENCEIEFFRSMFSVSGTFPPSDWVIKDGWYAQLAPTANSGAVTPPTGLIDLGNAFRVIYEGNTFVQTAGATFNYYINIGSSANDWMIVNNYVPVLLGTINNGIIQIAAGATNILERANDFSFAGTRVVNGAWATATVASEAYIEDQSSNVCHLVGTNMRGGIGSRVIECAATLVKTLAGTPGIATVTLPANIFATQPAVTISNGFTGGALWMCTGETPTTGTPPAFTLLCYSQTGTNVTGNVRIQYTATGA